jgi:hypothetical protein
MSKIYRDDRFLLILVAYHALRDQDHDRPKVVISAAIFALSCRGEDMANSSSSFDLDYAGTSDMQTARTPQHSPCVQAFRGVPVNQVEGFHGMMGAWFSWNALHLGSHISNIRLAATAFSSVDWKVDYWLSVVDDRCSFG